MASSNTSILAESVTADVVHSSPHPEGFDIEAQQHSSRCSCCTCCGGRKIRWQQGLSLSGVAFDVAIVALSVLRISNFWGAVATAGGSALIHCFSTAALYIWQPERDLEKTVDKAGEVEKKVDHESDSLQKELEELRRLTAEQERQLTREREFAAHFQQSLEEKVREIAALTDELETVRKGLEEARSITAMWKRLSDGLREQIAHLHPEQLNSEIDSMQQQMATLSSSEATFERELSELTSQTESVREAKKCWIQMFGQITAAFQGLTTDLQAKKALLASAETEILKLKQEAQELQGVRIDFEQLQGKYAQLSTELARTTEELAKALSILQNPQFAQILKKFTTDDK